MANDTFWPSSPADALLPARKRVAWARAFILIALLLFIGRAFQWTVLQGKELEKRAESNMVVRRTLNGPRGAIYDAHGLALARNVPSFRLEMARYRNSPDEIRDTIHALESLLQRPLDQAAEKVIHAESRWTRVLLARNLSLQEITPILERRPTLAGLLVEEETHREYLLGRAGGPIVGYTGYLWPSELEDAKAQGLAANARVGRAGLEKHYELQLRGQQGGEAFERDARGRRRRTLREDPGLPGCDLYTSLDSDLQRRAYDLLQGYTGALLAMDPETGEILALAVRPSFDAQAPGRPAPEGETNSFLNRAVMQHYPPGSPFKLVVALAGLLNGHPLYERRVCHGSIELDSWPGRPFYCDNRAGHGALGMSAAIKYSCNVYFYELADDLGPGAILDAASLLQLDQRTGIDLPGEVSGSLASIRPDDVDDIQEILLGIGQGPLALTPVQVLQFMGAIASRGRLVTPHLGRVLIGPDGTQHAPERRKPRFLDVSPRLWEQLAESMHRVVNEEGGTAYRVGFPPSWNVCGKTGTAQHPPGDPDAWFTGFAPFENPEVAFVVLVEHGGHGGDVAAPIARDFLAAFFQEDLTSEDPELTNSEDAHNRPVRPALSVPPDPSSPRRVTNPRDLSDRSELPGPPNPFGPPGLNDLSGPSTLSGSSGLSGSPELSCFSPPSHLPPSTDSPHLSLHLVPGGGEEIQVGRDSLHSTTGSLTLMTTDSIRPANDFEWVRGGIIRGPRDQKQLALVFTGGDFGEGGHEILDTLRARNIKGAFFFTGDFIRKPEHLPIVKRILEEGHYLGPHSDKHLLYCPWEDRNRTLVTRKEFQEDLQKNIDDLCALGANRHDMQWWIPPYEWYNEDISEWSLNMGIRLFNFTPGTLSHADYTEADAKNYRSSDVIYDSILEYESTHEGGLNGFLLLSHVGASPKRTDKFFKRLPALLDELRSRGYAFVRLDQLLADAPLRPDSAKEE